MDSALRPTSTPELLDRTFHLYRTHFVLLAGIGVLLPALLLLLRLVFLQAGYVTGSTGTQPAGNSEQITWFYVACIGLVYILGHALASGATFYAVSRLHLGQPATIAESYKRVFARFPTVLRIVVSVFIRCVGPCVLAFFTLVGVLAAMRLAGGFRFPSPIVLGVITLVAFVLAGVWGFYIYIKYSMSVAACLAEKLGARDALKRSRFLTQQARFRIFLIFLLMGMIGLALDYAFTAPSLYYSFMHHGQLTTTWAIGKYIGGFVAAVAAGPISTIAIALVYYDQRIRKEAFDLQFMMESLDGLPQEQNAMSAT